VLRDLLDEDGFMRRGGFVFVEQAGAEAFESGRVFAGDHDLLRREAVFSGVFRGGAFAFESDGTGGTGTVGLVRGDLSGAGHWSSPCAPTIADELPNPVFS